MLKLLKISGDSLYPFYKHGQIVLAYKIFWMTKLTEGDFVVFHKLPYGLMIKQIKHVKKNRYFVEGTDPMSIDSRNFGLIAKSNLRYKLFSIKS